jgi:hypothetical protein
VTIDVAIELVRHLDAMAADCTTEQRADALLSRISDYLASVKREAAAEALEAASQDIPFRFGMKTVLRGRAAAIRRGE